MLRKRFLPGQARSRARKDDKFFRRLPFTADSWILNVGGALEDGLMTELRARGMRRGSMLNLEWSTLVAAKRKSPDLQAAQARLK